MPHVFRLHRESLKRKFAVYVVVAKSAADTYLYVGKTGDNREGCNPLISRCGNHFSYNEIHSQVRNKIPDHESRDYTYVFEHFDDYHADEAARRVSIDRINEMERWLNQEVQTLVAKKNDLKLLNEYRGQSHVARLERAKRAGFRTAAAKAKIDSLIAAVEAEVG
ncbi:hypothetical protein [Hydrogenophaga sp. R2]|uniref:hypothetical protein n=1 Tax=Hydrogenophaga sp. R2 TaxID=3132827 RepID=UPI003CF576D1